MIRLFDFPKNSFFGKVIPKSKFYEYGNISSKQRDLFVTQVEEIIWKYKLAPETINLPATSAVPEIQIFEIKAKADGVEDEVLRCIDKAIPYPIVFEVLSGDRIKMIAAFKRRHDANSEHWIQSEYYDSGWCQVDSERSPLHFSLNLGSVYEQILVSLSPNAARQGECLSDLFNRNEQIKKKTRQLELIKNKLKLEKQFNRKVELNAVLKQVNVELTSLLA